MRTKYAFLASLRRIACGLSVALLLVYPGISRADIENLYAEGYSSSVTITNPSNAYGAPDGNTAYGSYADAISLIRCSREFVRRLLLPIQSYPCQSRSRK